jgi:hypothetical protein
MVSTTSCIRKYVIPTKPIKRKYTTTSKPLAAVTTSQLLKADTNPQILSPVTTSSNSTNPLTDMLTVISTQFSKILFLIHLLFQIIINRIYDI